MIEVLVVDVLILSGVVIFMYGILQWQRIWNIGQNLPFDHYPDHISLLTVRDEYEREGCGAGCFWSIITVSCWSAAIFIYVV